MNTVPEQTLAAPEPPASVRDVTVAAQIARIPWRGPAECAECGETRRVREITLDGIPTELCRSCLGWVLTHTVQS